MSRRSAEADPTLETALQPEIVEPDATPVRILIVSEVRLYRDAIAAHLEPKEWLTIIGGTGRGDALLEIERLEPDLILLDVCDWHCLDLAEKLLQREPEIKVVAIGVPGLAGRALAASWQGIAGFVPCTGSIDDVISVIEGIVRREHRDFAGGATSAFGTGDELKGDFPTPAAVDLTPRESEILKMIEVGLSNKEIARDLRIEVGTVKNHVHNILEKLNVRRRNQAAHRLRARIALG